MEIIIENLKLVMYEKTMMKDRSYDQQSKSWVATGKPDIEGTNYTFRDEWDNSLKLYSRENKFRELEGKKVNIKAEISQTEFQGKSRTRVKLLEVLEV